MCSYHIEPFKTAVAIKEMINLKDEIDIKKIPQKKSKVKILPLQKTLKEW